MENDELIKLPISLTVAVCHELKDKHGIDKGNFGGLRFTNEELAKITELDLEGPRAGDLKDIHKLFPNLRGLSIKNRTIDNEYHYINEIRSIKQQDVWSIERCKNLERLSITNQEFISEIDLGKLPKLFDVNISNNASLATIDGIDKLSELFSLACYGNEWLQEIKNLDKAIVQNKDNFSKVKLDVQLFPKAIGYNHLDGTYNQEAFDALEQEKHIVKWCEFLRHDNFKGDKNVEIDTYNMCKMHNKACQILHDILPKNSSKFDTIVAVERYLAENVTYDDDTFKSRHTKSVAGKDDKATARVVQYFDGANSAYCCLVDNNCVCEGYARGEQYLLGLKGIQAKTVNCVGGKDNLRLFDQKNADNYIDNFFHFTLSSNAHSIIRIDDYYGLYSDPCWNATHYQRGDKSMPYTLLTKEDICKDHTLSSREAGYDKVPSDYKFFPQRVKASLEKSIRHNALFKNTQASDVKAQRAALQQDVMGIVRGANGRTYE